MTDFLGAHIWEILFLLNYIWVCVAVVNILLSGINPVKALSYLVIVIALPFIGLVVYYFLGQQYRKNKIFKKKNILNQIKIKQWQQKWELSEEYLKTLESTPLKKAVKLIKLLQQSQESPLTLHNQAEILVNGKAKFKRLFEDLKNAQQTIHLEYYILVDDEIGSAFIDLLCQKSRQGVKVRLSYDHIGSSLSRKTKRKLRETGVEYYAFMPVYFPKFTSKINYRNHRKIAVIDGKIGYLGGINIADRYLNDTPGNFWRDTHLRIEGEAVGSLQLQFLLNWDFVTPYEVVAEERFFPKAQARHETPMQIVASGPDTDWPTSMEAIFTAIGAAERYIYITTPYFIPNDEIITALTTAAKGGIDVKLIIPRESDSWLTKYATFSYMEMLLSAGIRIYLYKKGFIHAKMMVIDDTITTLGTSNIDNRSFHINFEINALIYHEETGKKALQLFQDDLRESQEIFLYEWTARSMPQKLKESFCRLWAPLL